MTNINSKTLATCILAFGLIGCGKNADEKTGQILPTEPASTAIADGIGEKEVQTSQWTETSELNVEGAESGTTSSLTAVLDPAEIPYPLYPNGSRYRIGGEGDLKIILFQTEDSFEEVDAYYQKEANLPRLSAMSDYVRYSTDNDDVDPWETTRPGIVIHQFNDATEREAVGANDTARTNIIMSFE